MASRRYLSYRQSNEIKAERVRNGLNQNDMAVRLGISKSSYAKKESGRVRFTDAEKVCVMEMLGMSLQKTNDIFFGEKFPIGTNYYLRVELMPSDPVTSVPESRD